MRSYLRFLIMIAILAIAIVTVPLAQVGPTVSVSPTTGAVGSAIFEVTVEGLEPDATYTIEFVFEGIAIFTSDEEANDDGVVVFSAASTEDDIPGTYTVQVIRNDSIIAVTEFDLTPAGTDDEADDSDETFETTGSISITPDSGPVSTLHSIELSDLNPDDSYTVEITAAETEEVVYRRIWTSDEDGDITIEIFAEEGDTTGQQIVTVYDADGALVAEADFTIEDSPERNVVIDVDPTAANAGNEITFTVEGLVSFDNVTLQVVSDDNALIDSIQARASSEGVAILSLLTSADLADGEYVAEIFVDGTKVGDTSFTIGDVPITDTDADTQQASPSDITFSVEPEAGPVGSVHTMSISGLDANQAITLTITNDNDEIEYSTTEIADDDGEFSINISSSEGDEPGTYPVRVADATSGQVLGSGQMIITEGDAPESSEPDEVAQVGSPSISVEPDAGEIGDTHVISLSGMPAGTRIGVTIRAEADDTLAQSSVVAIDDNGEGTLEFTSRDTLIPGTYTVSVLLPSGETLTETISLSGAIITIDPQSGPIGTAHTIEVTGLEPNEELSINVSFDGEVIYGTRRTADADGVTSLTLSTDENDAPGDYTITVLRVSGSQPSVTLTVTETDTGEETETTEETASETDVSADAEVIEGELEDGIASIEFSGEAGDYVVITVESDDFDTVAAIYDQDFFEIGYNDDSLGGTNSRVGPLLLPYAGDYTLEISESYYDDQPAETGAFVATIQPVTVSPIVFGEATSFSISPESPAAYYELTVAAGSSLDIVVDSQGTLDTTLEILYSDGYQFAFDDDGGSGFDAEFTNLVFTAEDTYVLVVSSFIAGSVGEGSVTVMEQPIKSLDEGAVTITLNDKSYTDLAVFEAEEGDTVTINLEKLSGSVEDLYVYATVDGMQVMYYTTMGIPDNLPLVFMMPLSGEVVVTFEEFGFGGGISFNVTVEKE